MNTFFDFSPRNSFTSSITKQQSAVPKKLCRTKIRLKKLFSAVIAAMGIFSALILSGCAKKIDYFDYVSELRNNILTASEGEFALTVFAVNKESPYAADGIKREVSPRAEIRLAAPAAESYNIYFTYADKKYGGDASYDNIKGEYFYSCTADISTAKEIVFEIDKGETESGDPIRLTAKTVLTENCLSPKEIWKKAKEAKAEKLSTMTDEKGFAGEIYLRLIYEEKPYYYIGIIDRDGRICALLLDSSDGKILAEHEN